MPVIDTDTHAVEPSELWTDRMSKKWGSDVPHVRYDPETNSDMWYVRDAPIIHAGFCVITSSPDGEPTRDKDHHAHIKRFDDMHPSAWDPVARAKVMDKYGIDMAVLYPNLGFVGPDIYRVLDDSDLEYQVAVAQAYNDWVLGWDEAAPGRFIPLACVPYWDMQSAIKEVERCAELGHRGFVMTGAPDRHGEPLLIDRHWDPLWSAIQATGTPVSFHVGGGLFKKGIDPLAERAAIYGRDPAGTFLVTNSFLDNASIVADLLTSGILPRFPDLKFISVESGVNWIPFVLQAVDYHARQYRIDKSIPEFTELPSYYFRRQVYANFWFEHVTDAQIEDIGPGNVLFETDFPHPTCLIDDDLSDALNGLSELRGEYREQILWRNAAALFGVGDHFKSTAA